MHEIERRTAILPGNLGIKPQNMAPDFDPERQPSLDYHFRHVPAVFRVANEEVVTKIPLFSEELVYAATRFWLDPDRRRLLRHRPGPNVPFHSKTMQEWVLLRENRDLLSWWSKPYAWRAPREFHGYNAIVTRSGVPRIEPFEVAHMRLPDDVACDADVVLFQAWCQGWGSRDWQRGKPKAEVEPRNMLHEGHGKAIRSGLAKMLRSPWVQFALAAPYMTGIGVQFKGSSIFESHLRMEWLVKHPYTSTDAELRVIFESPSYMTAIRRAWHARMRGEVINPDGGWYAGGAIRLSLGTHFRRGGLQPARRTA